MKSRTIGSGGDDADIPTWEAQIDDSDSETGTCIQSAALDGGSQVTYNVTLTGGHAALLTANAGSAVAAPTWAALTSKARIEGSGFSPIFNISGDGLTVEKIGVRATSGNAHAIATAIGTFAIRRCVLSGSGTPCGGLSVNTGTVTVSNCAAFAAPAEIGFGLVSGTLNLYHCSVGGSTFAGFYQSSGAMSAYACVAQGNVFDFFGSIGGDYNVSEDASAPGSAATKYARSSAGWFTNETATSEDFSLVAGKQGWWAANKDAIDQTGWPADVGTDIVGTTRTAPIDPGVWQTPAGGGNPPNATYAEDSQPCEGSNGTITPTNTGDAITSSAVASGTLPTGYVLNANGTISKTGASMVVGDIGSRTVYVDLTNAAGTQSDVPVPIVITANPPVRSYAGSPFTKHCAYASSTANVTDGGGPAVATYALNAALGGLAINSGTGQLTFDPDISEGIGPTQRIISGTSAGGQIGTTAISVEFDYLFTVSVNSGADTALVTMRVGGGDSPPSSFAPSSFARSALSQSSFAPSSFGSSGLVR